MKKLSDCRVLLVDDAKANLDILVEGLKGEYKLSLALNGEMALQIAERMNPDLVLLDIVMPGIDGYEVCRRLRQKPETADVPIIFLSSLEEVQNKARGFEAGANDYVTKPFELVEVKARVRSLLKAKAYSDAIKEQIAGELRVAHEIQMGMVPSDFSAIEASYPLELAAVLEPAREVGGDLFGVYPVGADRIVVVLGDVSGKGIPAALFMVRTCSLVRLLARDIAEPERILSRLNDELSEDNPSGMFVTMVCAVIEPKARRIRLANGGQCQPLFLRPGSPPVWAIKHLGTALGFEPGLAFEGIELTMSPGDSLFLYTDGVIEAFNGQNELYGNNRLLDDTAELVGKSAKSVATGILAKVRQFVDKAPQSDDIGILTVRLTGPADKVVMSASFQATPEEVMRAVEQMQTIVREQGVGESDQFILSLALEECGSNIVNHAYGKDSSRQFQVVLYHNTDCFIIELRDQGPPFDPTQKKSEPECENPEDRAPGGWGIDLVRRKLDSMQYYRFENENVLRLIKMVKISSPGSSHGILNQYTI